VVVALEALFGGGVGGMRWRIRAPSQQFHHPGGWESGNQRDSWSGASAMKALKTRRSRMAAAPFAPDLQIDLGGDWRRILLVS